jgi:hypothetical protein
MYPDNMMQPIKTTLRDHTIKHGMMEQYKLSVSRKSKFRLVQHFISIAPTFVGKDLKN